MISSLSHCDLSDVVPFRMSLRVYYEDTDAAGIVYYANYLKFAERARTDMLRSFQIDHTSLRKKHDVVFVVRSCTIDFLKPGYLDDRLTVLTSIRRVMGPVVKMDQQIVRVTDVASSVNSEVLCALAVTIACVNSSGEPVILPRDVQAILSSAMTSAIESV